MFKSLNRFFEYVLGLLAQNKPIKICYLGTAANDNLIQRLFFSTYLKIKFNLRLTHLRLTRRISVSEIEKCLSSNDILFIGGGNTANMLKIWENKGFLQVLNKLRKEDKLPILAGVSAGGMYPFHSGLTDSTKGQYQPLRCLEWIKESFCPHADSKQKALCVYENNQYLERLPAFQAAIKKACLPAGYAVPDNCMLHFYNNRLIKAFTSVESTSCYYISINSVTIIETILLTKLNCQNVITEILEFLTLRSFDSAA